MTHKIELSISPYPLATKIDGGDLVGWANLYRSLEHVALDIAEIANYVYKGHVIGPVLNGWRSYAHFIKAQFVALDMDTETQQSAMSTLMERDIVRIYGGLIYSTPSSRPGAPRSRVIHLLEKPITDPYQYKKAIKTIAAYYPGHDRASAEPTRTYFGNAQLAQTQNTDGIFFSDGFIPMDDLWMMHAAQMKLAEAQRKPRPDYSQCDLDVSRLLRGSIRKAADGHRNHLGYWLACRLVEGGVPEPEQEDIMRQYAAGVPQVGSPYTETEALRSLMSARRGL